MILHLKYKLKIKLTSNTLCSNLSIDTFSLSFTKRSIIITFCTSLSLFNISNPPLFFYNLQQSFHRKNIFAVYTFKYFNEGLSAILTHTNLLFLSDHMIPSADHIFLAFLQSFFRRNWTLKNSNKPLSPICLSF